MRSMQPDLRYVRVEQLLVLIVIALSVMQAAPAMPTDGEPTESTTIVSWQALEDEFRKENWQTLDAEEWKRIARWNEILESGNDVLWWSMLEQGDRPLVAIAGFQCIQHADAERAARAAVRVLGSAQVPGFTFYAPVYSCLRQKQWSNADHQLLDWLALAAHIPKENAALIAGMIPGEVIDKWFHSRPFIGSASHSSAFLFDRLCGYYERERKPMTEKMRLHLDKLSAVPGLGRYVYVLYSENTEAKFKDALVLALVDEHLTAIELVILVRKRHEMVWEIYPRLKPMVTDDRLGKIDDSLRRAKGER